VKNRGKRGDVCIAIDVMWEYDGHKTKKGKMRSGVAMNL